MLGIKKTLIVCGFLLSQSFVAPRALAAEPKLLIEQNWDSSTPVKRGRPDLLAPRSFLVIGTALALGSVATAVFWANRANRLDSCQTSPNCRNVHDLEHVVKSYRVSTWVLASTAVAALVGGGFWLAHRKHEPTRPLAFNADVSREATLLTASLRF